MISFPLRHNPLHLHWLLLLILAALPCSCARRSTPPAGPLPERYEAALAEGKRLAGLRLHSRARPFLEQAIRLSPSEPEAYELLGDSYLRTRRYEDSIRTYRALLEAVPGRAEGLIGLWNAEMERSGFSEESAQKVKEEAAKELAAGPPTGDRIYAAAVGFYMAQAPEEVWRLVAENAEAVKDPRRRGDLAEIVFFFVINRGEDAPRRLELFPKLFSTDPERYWAYARLLRRAGDSDEALLKEADAILAREAGRRIPRYLVASALLRRGLEPARAEKLLREALELLAAPDPLDRPTYVTDAAWKEELAWTKGSYLYELCRALEAEGRLGEAAESCREGAPLNPFEPDIPARLGEVCEKLGDKDRAIEAYRQALERGRPSAADGVDAAGRLDALLSEKTGVQTSGRDFFAKREGVKPFTEITEEAGLADARGTRLAFGDADGDGDQDLLVNGARLFLNDGKGDFKETAMPPGLEGANGGLFGDVNGDGRLDIFVMSRSAEQTPRCLVLINRGGAVFAPLDNALPPEAPGLVAEGAVFGDFNGDGALDLYAADYETYSPFRGVGQPDRFYFGRGDGTFEEHSREAGVQPEEYMCGRGAAAADYDNDGDLDIYIANYRLDPDFLFRNLGGGKFENVALEAGVAGTAVEGCFGHGIGPDWGDADGDGDLDVFVANLAHPRALGLSDTSRLFINSGPPDYRFVDERAARGVAYSETHSNPTFLDLDLDGDLDLYLTAVYTGRESFLYRNTGGGSFEDVTWLSGTRIDNGWGSATADVDGDGDPDLAVASGGQIRLFRNETLPAGTEGGPHWLAVLPILKRPAGFAVGARVVLTQGNKRLVREVMAGEGTGVQSSPWLLFGLGADAAPADLEVRFPGGERARLEGVAPDQRVEVYGKR